MPSIFVIQYSVSLRNTSQYKSKNGRKLPVHADIIKKQRKFNSYSEDYAVLFYIWLLNFYSSIVLTEYFTLALISFIFIFYLVINAH